ncbi:hypothetical protein [Bacillus thermotolerans]|uniref:hypothetical protein n=1 Tax=Bacillus thermotolerans TaxID=1221996 RepID=UPI0015845A60|nr:hypothetical protein [Bacillus thermotolerans]
MHEHIQLLLGFSFKNKLDSLDLSASPEQQWLKRVQPPAFFRMGVNDLLVVLFHVMYD